MSSSCVVSPCKAGVEVGVGVGCYGGYIYYETVWRGVTL